MSGDEGVRSMEVQGHVPAQESEVLVQREKREAVLDGMLGDDQA